MQMNVHQFQMNFLALKESISLDFDKRELVLQCLAAWFVRVKGTEFPIQLNQVFQEWHSFVGEQGLKGLVAFLSEHLEIAEQDRKSLLHVILSERYGLDYLSGRRMSVSQYLNNLASSEEYSALEPDPEELTRQFLVVYLHITKKAPNLKSLCEKYPHEAKYIQRFWQENHAWLDVLPAPLAEPILPSNRKEIISETYQVPDPPIGHGGQKIVYKIVQESTLQTLALKVPSRKGKASDLIKEARIQARLSHQGIPAVFSLSSGSDTPTRLVERYIVGEAWSELLPQLTLEENLDILERTSRILASAHLEHHIIHGDLKPQNVKVNRQYNEVYLVDWGLAIHLDEIPSMAANSPGENDGKLVFRGSVDYLPPEVANNQTEKICLSTDVFMLGATLYQILAGSPPYAAITSSLVAICYAQAGQ